MAPRQPNAGPAKRILVVDDNLLDRKLTERWLERGGFAVQTAESGEIALEMVRRHPPDAILADLNMPGLGGLALCQALRADPATAVIPVVVCSASMPDEWDPALALRAGATCIATKSLGMEHLLQAIRQAMGT